MAKKFSFAKLYRSDSHKLIAGVCGGLGEYFNIDPTILRLIFVIITLFGGSGIILYAILWIIIPSEKKLGKDSEEYIRENIEEMKSKTQSISSQNPKTLVGLVLIIFGLAFFFNNLGIFHFEFFWKFWPIVLVVFGFLVLTK